MSKDIDITDELISREETSGYSFEKSKEDIELAQKINKIIHYDFKDNIKNDIFIVLDALVRATELKDLPATQTLIKNQYYMIKNEKERHLERIIQNQQEKLEKKDKIIDYMIEWIRERSIYAVDSSEELKQYFEKKVEE